MSLYICQNPKNIHHKEQTHNVNCELIIKISLPTVTNVPQLITGEWLRVVVRRVNGNCILSPPFFCKPENTKKIKSIFKNLRSQTTYCFRTNLFMKLCGSNIDANIFL